MLSRRHISIIAVSTVGLLGVASGLAMSPLPRETRTIVGMSGGDRFIFRIFDDGSVDFLDLNSPKTTRGIADWTALSIEKGRRSKSFPAR